MIMMMYDDDDDDDDDDGRPEELEAEDAESEKLPSVAERIKRMETKKIRFSVLREKAAQRRYPKLRLFQQLKRCESEVGFISQM
jgi:hypothetical protein